jgi:hypothetical protein
MNLERYRVPAAVWEGEWLELPESGGAKFLVKLPASSNREWQREALSLLTDAGVRVDEKGVVNTDALGPPALIALRTRRLELFARLCVVRGPEGFDLSALSGEYWPALAALYDLAVERAKQQEQEVDEAVGESSASPAGRKSGPVARSSTRTS